MQPSPRLAIKFIAAFGSFDLGQRARQGRVSSFDTYFYDKRRGGALIQVKQRGKAKAS
jgi:hypothetical protein